MNKLFKKVLLILPIFLYAVTLFPGAVKALIPCQVNQGCTGQNTITGIPIGTGITPLSIVTIGSGLSLVGTTLSATGGGTGTVTSIATTAPITGGTITTTGTIGITQSTTSTDGYLSSTDWNTFNTKQPAGSYITALTGEGSATGPGSSTLTLSNAAVIGKVLTGYTSGAGTVSASDSLLSAIQKLNGNTAALVTGVSSVSNSDGTLTISPTTGAVIASLALGHANTWTGQQTFNTAPPIIGTGTPTGVVFLDTLKQTVTDGTNFVWDSSNFNLRLGPTSAQITPENRLSVIGNANDYHGIYVQNLNSGTTASTDIVAGNNLTGAADYFDFGVNSSGNTNPAMTLFGVSDAYIFTGPGGALGNINIAAGGTGKTIRLATGGTLSANLRLTISDTQLTSRDQLTWAPAVGSIVEVLGATDQALDFSTPLTSGGIGNNINITTPDATSNGVAGNFTVTTGISLGANNGGNITLTANKNTNSGAGGGQITLTGNGGGATSKGVVINAATAAIEIKTTGTTNAALANIVISTADTGSAGGTGGIGTTAGAVNLITGLGIAGTNGTTGGGGDGGPVLFRMGNGGAASGLNSGLNGGNAGTLTFTGGTGGAALATTNTHTGGIGTGVTFTLGTGGAAATNGTGTGGVAGGFTLTGGTGGAATGAGGTHLGGAGSSLLFTSGNGGAATGASGTRNGGDSGSITLNTGTPGTGATANGTNGGMFFQWQGTTKLSLGATNGNVTISALALYGSGLGLSQHLLGPNDSLFGIGARTPVQAASTLVGNALNVFAGSATAGASVAGAASGGAITITSGNAARLTSGNGNGGDVTVQTGTGIGTGTPGNISFNINGATTVMQISPAIASITGDLKLTTAGNGIYIKEGTNATMGICTLVLGTCTVNTTKVTANSRIQITAQSLGTVAVAQAIAVTARTAATSFVITSANATDTSVVAWIIVEPN